jgi:Carboxypeptidase regulatory-like domain
LTTRQQYWLAWAPGVWLAAGLISLLAIGGCRRGVPVVDPSGGLPAAEGTISGTVRGPESVSAIEGRIVEIVNLETNERQRASTNSAGGFTFKVRPGRYRVELTLRDGESLVKQPGIMNVNKSDVDAHADFVIGSTRISRPRSPAMRTDHGLGSPIA